MPLADAIDKLKPTQIVKKYDKHNINKLKLKKIDSKLITTQQHPPLMNHSRGDQFRTFYGSSFPWDEKFITSTPLSPGGGTKLRIKNPLKNEILPRIPSKKELASKGLLVHPSNDQKLVNMNMKTNPSPGNQGLVEMLYKFDDRLIDYKKARETIKSVTHLLMEKEAE